MELASDRGQMHRKGLLNGIVRDCCRQVHGQSEGEEGNDLIIYILKLLTLIRTTEQKYTDEKGI